MIKADTPRRYRWVGRDNSALRAELDDDLAGLQRQFDDISRRVEIARGTTRTGQARIGELEQIQKDLSWTDLDLEPTTRRLGVGAIEAYRPLGVEEDLDRYDQPDSTLTLAEASALAALELAGGKYLRIEKSGFSSVTPSTPLRRPGISWRLISPRSGTASRRTGAARG